MKGPHRAPLKWTCKETCVFKRHDGVQVHVLSYLGERWGMGAPRFSTEDVVRWSRERTRNGCALTWDVPIQANGLMSQPFIDQLTAVGQVLGRP